MQRFVAWSLVLVLGLAAGAIGTRPVLAQQPPHHEITLTLDPGSGGVRVRNLIRLSGRERVTLRLAAWMRIVALKVNGQVATSFDGRPLLVVLPSADEHQIDITAEGVIPPIIAGTGKDAAMGPRTGLDGVYLPGWTQWFPHLDEDAMSFDLTIETPPDIRAAATGRFEREQLGTTQNTVRFSSTGAPERPSVFAGPYAVSERQSAGVRIRTYFHKSVERFADGYIDAASRHIRYFEGQIGPYPFPDFHIVSAPLPVGLGFPGLTYIDQRILPLPFIMERSLAHEVLHNWWGNGVVTDDAGGNWAEGLTTYMADHALTAHRNPKDALELRLGWLRDFAALPAERDIPVVGFRSKTHDASQVVGYGKVALIFHMLHQDLGDQAFYEGLRRFWQAHKFGAASWADIRAAFEATTRLDLGFFFEQWTMRAGAPQLELKDAAVLRRADAYELTLSLAQSMPAYRLNVPVEIVTAAGIVRTRVVLDGASTTARISLNSAPTAVRIDPDHSLFRRLLPGEAPPIFRDVLLDSAAHTFVLYDEPARESLARQLAERLFDAPPIYGNRNALPEQSLLVIGPAGQIDRLMQSLDTPPRPADVAGKGKFRAWVARRANGKNVLLIEAENTEELQTLLRLLPHYRSKSYAVGEGGRITASGVMPPVLGPLAKEF